MMKKATLVIEDENGLFDVLISVNATIEWAGVEWALDDPDVGTVYNENLHAGLLVLLGRKLGIEHEVAS